jgi:hypothetical protein
VPAAGKPSVLGSGALKLAQMPECPFAEYGEKSDESSGAGVAGGTRFVAFVGSQNPSRPHLIL